CFVNRGAVTSVRYAGGFIGHAVQGAIFNNCYIVGVQISAYGDTRDGAFTSTYSTPTLNNCYYNPSSSPALIGQGATLLTDEQFKDPANLVGFDFENVWTTKQDVNDG